MKPITSIGIIMDGNRRWARERGLPTLEGHRKGYEKLKELLAWSKEADIRHVMVFGFSTENWKRSEEEVAYLMDLLRTMLIKDAHEIKEKGGRIRIVGERERFSKEIQMVFDEAETITKDGTHTLWLGLSYGGRAEILAAVNRLVVNGKPVNEEEFSNALWTAGMPDTDIIIRTSGEKRLSGFLPWAGVYSELFFIPTYWPDFSKEEFQKILAEYAERDRRHGQ